MVRVIAAPPPPPPGKPRGNLESYNWPTEATVGEDKDFSLMVHNNGEASGTIGAGIANMDGNPGNIIVTVEGETFEIPPGQVLLLYVVRGVCERLGVVGKVKFMAEGTYVIRLMGLHQEGDQWIIDTYVDING